jgi:large subunit ribosomal protein L18
MKNVRLKKISKRHNKIRSRVSGTLDRPRLAVAKSNRQIIVQLINDEKGETLAYAWTKNETGKTMAEKAKAVGIKIAEQAKVKKITNIVFDRGGHSYTGNIKAVADAAREGGLSF